MLNVDAGNQPHRPDNPRELGKAWRVTWLAIAGFVLLVLLFFGVGRLRNGTGEPGGGASQERPIPGPGERELGRGGAPTERGR